MDFDTGRLLGSFFVHLFHNFCLIWLHALLVLEELLYYVSHSNNGEIDGIITSLPKRKVIGKFYNKVGSLEILYRKYSDVVMCLDHFGWMSGVYSHTHTHTERECE